MRFSQNLSASQIARELGISRNTVRTALAADVEPKYRRAAKGSIVDAVEPQIRALLATDPQLAATRIAEKIGWTHSIRTLSARVAMLRPEYEDGRPTATDQVTIAHLGLWFPATSIPVAHKQIRTETQLPVLMLALDHSRVLIARLLPSQRPEDLFAGARALLATLGAMPSLLVWAMHPAVGAGHDDTAQPTDAARRFAEGMGTELVVARGNELANRDVLERSRGQLHKMFLPGRRFCSPSDFNEQLTSWLLMFDTQPRGLLDGDTPANASRADLARMASLPSAAMDLDEHLSAQVRADGTVGFETNHYAVSADLVGATVEVIADLAQVRVLLDGRTVATHERSWAQDVLVAD